MQIIWEWFWFIAPWPIKVMLIAIPIGMGVWLAGMAFGWERVRPFVIPIAGVLLAVGFVNKAQVEGWRANERRRNDEADKMVDKAQAVRRSTEAKLRADPDEVYKPDRHMRKD